MSDKSCENDCTLPLRFPRRPGTQPPAEHGDGCPCCGASSAGISQDNRPSLSRFNYRIGTYGSIREFLFQRINSTPELQNWTHRAPDDPAVALLEGASILGDILTFYQETYANEAFLRTAAWRESISDLVRLLGYRLSPSVGGNAVFAFELKKDEPVVIPAGFPLKATLEELTKPAEFETIAELTAYPWLNRFNLFRPLQDVDITPETTEFYISDPDQLTDFIDIKVGDRLMVSDADTASLSSNGSLINAETVIVDSISELHGQKLIKIKGKLKPHGTSEGLFAYRLGRTFHHFGQNHPVARADSTSAQMVDSSGPVTSTATLNTATNTTTTSSTIPKVYVPMIRGLSVPLSESTVSLALSNFEFPLDSEVTDIANSSAMIFEFGYLDSNRETNLPHIHLVRTIDDIRSSPLTWGAISGTASIVKISQSLNDSIGDPAFMFISDAAFYEVLSAKFVLKPVRSDTPDALGKSLNFYGTEAEANALKQRRIMFEKPGSEPWVVTVADVVPNDVPATADFPRLRAVTLAEQVTYADFPNENPIVTVFGNLADADEGKTLPEVPIGSGNELLVFQNFKIPKAPLTYHIVPENTPSETPELEIYVDGRLWTQVDSFFGRGKDEQIYIVREDADGNSWVQFGDGNAGARLATGVNNVTALYRMGSGAFGALKTDTKVQPSAKLKNLDKIGMPMDASGGAPREDGESARNAAPGKVQSLGRIVSLKDFEAETAAIPGVASASAAWQLVDNIPAVVLTVLMETGRSTEIEAVRDTISAYNIQRGAARHSVDVVLGKRLYATVSVQYALKPTYRADVVEPLIRVALGVNFGKATRDEDQTGLFSLRRRGFGAREYASTIEGTVQNVEGVLWAKTVAFKELGPPTDPDDIAKFNEDDPETYVLPLASVLEPIVSCDGGHILSLFDKHLSLAAVAEGGS